MENPAPLLQAWGTAYAVAVPLAAMAGGVMLGQLSEYCSSFWATDTRLVRASVIVVYLMTFTGLAIQIYSLNLKVSIGVSYTLMEGFTLGWWEDNAVQIFSSVTQGIVQLFFIRSAARFAKSIIVTTLLCIGCFLSVTGGIVSALFLYVFGIPLLREKTLGRVYSGFLYVWLASSALTDAALAIILIASFRAHCRSLANDEFNHARSKSVLMMIASQFIATFSLSAALQSLLLAFSIWCGVTTIDSVTGSGFKTGAKILGCPVFAVCFMYTLNRRNALRSRHVTAISRSHQYTGTSNQGDKEALTVVASP